MGAFYFFAYSNLLIAFSATAIAWGSFRVFGMAPDFAVLGVIFCSTLLIYSTQRIIKFYFGKQIKSQRHWYKQNIQFIITGALISLVALCFLVFKLNILQIYVFLTCALFSMLYYGLIPFTQKTGGLRHLPYLKNFVVAAIWMIVTVLIPLFSTHEKNGISNSELVFAIERFLFIYALCIPFDIRDIMIDDPGLKTLPQIFGEKTARLTSLALLLLCLLLHLMFQPFGFSAVASLLFYPLAMATVQYSKGKKEIYYHYFIDGTIFVAGGLYLLGWFLSSHYN